VLTGQAQLPLDAWDAHGRQGGPSDRAWSGGEALLHSCERAANLLGCCADRANIGMKGAVYAKRGTAFGTRLGHQQVAPTGEDPVRHNYISPWTNSRNGPV
jgi:hypothetical protein